MPLYKKIKLLKSDAFLIIAGINAGCIAGISSIVIFSSFFGLDEVITNSLVPKSVTTSIGIEISKQIGGLPAITMAAIIVTGVLGAIIGPSMSGLAIGIAGLITIFLAPVLVYLFSFMF